MLDPFPHLQFTEGLTPENVYFVPWTSPATAELPPSAVPAKPPGPETTNHSVPETCGAESRVAAEPLGRDRRQHPRRDSACHVKVCLAPAAGPLNPERCSWLLHASPLTGRLVDVSMGGVALALPEPLPADHDLLIRVQVRVPGQSEPQLDLRARVLRSHTGADGGWTVVCRLPKPLRLEQVTAIGRHIFPGALV